VALHFGNESPWYIASEKGIESLIAWLIPTIGLPDLLTYLFNFVKFIDTCHFWS